MPMMMSVMPGPSSPFGQGGLVDLLADAADERDGEEPAEAAAEAEGEGLQEAVGLVEHEQRDAENGAVDGDQRQEDAEGVVELLGHALDDHLDELRERRDHDDEHDELAGTPSCRGTSM